MYVSALNANSEKRHDRCTGVDYVIQHDSGLIFRTTDRLKDFWHVDEALLCSPSVLIY